MPHTAHLLRENMWHLPNSRRRRPCPGAARLVYDFAQVPATHLLGREADGGSRVSCVAFDAVGALVASGSVGGRVGVQQVEQYVPSAQSAASRAAGHDAAALHIRPSAETKPLIEFATSRTLNALGWRPDNPNQFAAAVSAARGGAGGPSVLIYDLGASRPSRPAHSCISDPREQGALHDLLFLDAGGGGCTVVRDPPLAHPFASSLSERNCPATPLHHSLSQPLDHPLASSLTKLPSPTQRPRAVEQHESAREALLCSKGGRVVLRVVVCGVVLVVSRVGCCCSCRVFVCVTCFSSYRHTPSSL